ncbi:MAG: NYN domain-containing protein [Clostridia bacterium]|nr:NYN domain-containing protein [Clostridia bacterium]
MFGLFKKKDKKLTAAVFVDYEHWYYSLNNNFGMKPDIKQFYHHISEVYDIKGFFVFGDFSKNPIKFEVDRIREVTTSIIDSQNTSPHSKKDFTDFIMLDSIYRCADSRPDIQVYILFTGDGHFGSVAGYLRNSKLKKLVVYGVTGSVSSRLKTIASECYEIPSINQERIQYYQMIIKNFEFLSKSSKQVNATFTTTVKAVAKHNKCKESYIANALRDLIEKEVIIKQFAQAGKDKITVLSVDWEKAMQEGLWDANKTTV